METILSLSTVTILSLIENAKKGIVFLTPGLHQVVAEKLVFCSQSIGIHNIEVIIDPSPEVCRLGYGFIDSVQLLMEVGIEVRKAFGVRIGILIVDSNAWIFTPTPLLLEEEQDGRGLNAVSVNNEQALALISSISPRATISHGDSIEEGITKVTTNSSTKEFKEINFKNTYIKSPIETAPYTTKDLMESKKDLTQRPPKKFDFERRVRVYNSYIQFVELSLTGIQLNRHTIKIPSELLAVSNSVEVREKLNSTYRLIDEKSKVSGKDIENRIAELRKIYLRSVGKRLGMVILVSKKEEFEKKIKEIEGLFNEFSINLKGNLEKELLKTRKELIKILLPGIKANPPIDLKGVINGKKPTKDEAINYINVQLDRVIPAPEKVINKMEINYEFKAVTYEMLKDPEFQSNIKKKFPGLKLPYKDYEAIQEQESEQQSLPI